MFPLVLPAHMSYRTRHVMYLFRNTGSEIYIQKYSRIFYNSLECSGISSYLLKFIETLSEHK